MNRSTTEMHPCRIIASLSGLEQPDGSIVKTRPGNSLVKLLGEGGAWVVDNKDMCQTTTALLNDSCFKGLDDPYPLSVLAEYLEWEDGDFRSKEPPAKPVIDTGAPCIDKNDDVFISRKDFNWNVVLVDEEETSSLTRDLRCGSSSSLRDGVSSTITTTDHRDCHSCDEDQVAISRNDFDWNVYLVNEAKRHDLEVHKENDLSARHVVRGAVSPCNNATFAQQEHGTDSRHSHNKAATTATSFVGGRSEYSTTTTSSSSWGPVKMLPPDFEPLPYSVVVGKCKESLFHTIGNQRLRVLASNYATRYAKAVDEKDKKGKSAIVSTLVSTIQNACPVGAFIRFGKDGRWYTVSQSVAREKVGYTFRELLGDQYYRSSSKAKLMMRSTRKKIDVETTMMKTKTTRVLPHP